MNTIEKLQFRNEGPDLRMFAKLMAELQAADVRFRVTQNRDTYEVEILSI